MGEGSSRSASRWWSDEGGDRGVVVFRSSSSFRFGSLGVVDFEEKGD